MTKTIFGERVGKLGKIAVGCSATIFDATKQKVLLTRRSDNGKWCLPSGQMEPGESAAETCVREVMEETGLSVQIKRLIGLYTNPNRLIEYPDGNRIHLVALNFEADVLGGELTTSNETTEFGYFSLPQIYQMDMLQVHIERIEDAFKEQAHAFVR
ncbi:MAG: NUDIX domain-containing protein [Chloroflexi bacterium]|nr:NUDIX domain-containing protein [Chloroflexota bacterium]